MAEALGLKILDLVLVAALDADTFHTTWYNEFVRSPRQVTPARALRID
jgi:hypothetical protein